MNRLAVVGCGYWGPNLIRNFKNVKDCDVDVVCDTNMERLKYVKKMYNDIDVCIEYDEILKNKNIDSIVIATPVRFHFKMAMDALKNGKNVFIEKPMATSVAECEQLIKESDERNLVLVVGHTFIYSQAVIKIREIVSSGELGEIQYIGARRLNLGLFQTDINVAWDLAPHDISIILYTLGKMPVSVNCQGKAHLHPKIEDVTNMTLNYENGGFACIQSSWLDPNKTREMTFVGTKKMLVYNDLEPLEKIKIYDKRVECPNYYDTYEEFHYSYHYGDMYSPYLNQIEPLKVEAQKFIECIQYGKKSESSGREGLDVVKVLEAASKSLKNGGGRYFI